MIPLCNAIAGGDMRTTKVQSNPPHSLKNPWRACWKMLYHYQWVFQLACCARRIGLLSDWWHLLHQMTPNGKLCRPAVNKVQVVYALVMGYVHSNSKPSVANIQLPPRPMCGWWVNWLAFLTISYYNPHQCFRNNRINLPDEVQHSPYARMDLIPSKSCLLGDTSHTVQRFSDQPITVVLLSDHLFGYVPGLHLPIIHIPWSGLPAHQVVTW